ncbi:clathrin light chain-domain-containing protein [Mucidula mucida]|nr:clathrin light chain-domain-containing protein [Mucidula mucida]
MADLFSCTSAFPDISLDGDGDIPLPAAAPPSATQTTSGFSFDDFDSPPLGRSDTAVKVTGDDEIDKFENEFPDIEVPSSPPVMQSQAPSFGATFAPRPQPSALSSTPILTQTIQEDEPEVIRQWRERQQEEIEARDADAKAKRQETISKAERDMDDFYERYNEKKTATIASNKDKEHDYLQAMNDSLSTGTTWERICKLIDLENSQSKTIARAGPGTSDLTRFKEVLLRLKREGDAAPGAGGY